MRRTTIQEKETSFQPRRKEDQGDWTPGFGELGDWVTTAGKDPLLMVIGDICSEALTPLAGAAGRFLDTSNSLRRTKFAICCTSFITDRSDESARKKKGKK